jgi:hypothetical protein
MTQFAKHAVAMTLALLITLVTFHQTVTVPPAPTAPALVA